MPPSRIVQLERDAFSPTIVNNSEPPVFATHSSGPRSSTLTRPMPTSRSESTFSIHTQTPVGTHPDRITLLSVHDKPLSTVALTKLPPRTTSDSQQDPFLDERLVDRSRSLPTFPLETTAIVPPRNGPIPSSSRITLDDVTASTTPGLPSLVSFNTLSNSDNQHAPAHTPRNPNQSPNQGKGGQKRKATEVFPLPKPPKPPKKPRTKRGNNTGGPEVVKVQGRLKQKRRNRKKKGKTNLNSQSGPSNLYHQGGGGARGDGRNNGYAHEDGEVYDGYETGENPDYNPAPH